MKHVVRALPIGLWLGAISLPAPAMATNLDEALQAAERHAPVIAIADAEASAAKARAAQAVSGLFPTATASGMIGTGRLDPKGYFGLTADDVSPRAGQIVIEQPLFSGGRLFGGLRSARAGADAAKSEQFKARLALRVAVAQAYGQVIQGGRMVAQYQKLQDEMREISRQAEARFRLGESPRTDVSQAAAAMAEAEAGLALAEGALAQARARFETLTGLDGRDLLPIPDPQEAVPNLDEALARALDQSPALKQAEAGLKAARGQALAARGSWLPSISAFAEAASVRDQFFPGYTADSRTIGLRALWQISAGGRELARIREANAGERSAAAQLQSARDQIREAVISATEGVRTASRVALAAARRLTAAEDALTSVRAEVRVGQKTQTDLLDAERAQIAAAAALEEARTNRVVAAYQLRAVLGEN